MPSTPVPPTTSSPDASSATLTDDVDFTPWRRQNGFDLAWFQASLQDQGAKLEDQLRNVQKNANLSDTERMFEMQMLMNTWSTITNLRTNMMKSISDTLKTVVRNVA